MVKISKFDAADYLDSPEATAAYLSEAFETGDSVFVAQALNTVARAKGMSEVAASAGVWRESLYKSLNGETRPAFETVQKVIEALGLKMVIAPAAGEKAA